jgi:hypothetical protein
MDEIASNGNADVIIVGEAESARPAPSPTEPTARGELTTVDPPLDGEVLPPDPSPAEMEELFGEVNAAYAKLVRTTVEEAAEVGQALIKVKERFPHGSWLNWLERYTKIKRRTAANYMLLGHARANLPAPKWATIAQMGVAGALTEISQRAPEKKKAQEPATAEGQAAPAHDPVPEVKGSTTGKGSLKARLLRVCREYRAEHPDVDVEEIEKAAYDAYEAIFEGALDKGARP